MKYVALIFAALACSCSSFYSAAAAGHDQLPPNIPDLQPDSLGGSVEISATGSWARSVFLPQDYSLQGRGGVSVAWGGMASLNGVGPAFQMAAGVSAYGVKTSLSDAPSLFGYGYTGSGEAHLGVAISGLTDPRMTQHLVGVRYQVSTEQGDYRVWRAQTAKLDPSRVDLSPSGATIAGLLEYIFRTPINQSDMATVRLGIGQVEPDFYFPNSVLRRKDVVGLNVGALNLLTGDGKFEFKDYFIDVDFEIYSKLNIGLGLAVGHRF